MSRTVLDMVEARLGRLASSPQRDVVTAGAVLGDFETTLLAVVARAAGCGSRRRGGRGHERGPARDGRRRGRLPARVDPRGGARGDPAARAAHAARGGRRPRWPTGRLANATTLERQAQHLEQIGERDEAARLLTAAATARLDEHALLERGSAGSTRARISATASATRAAASDALAAVLAVQGRWTDALALDEATDREHGEQIERRHRMASCAMDAALPELAEALIARAIEAGDESPQVHVIAGRLAIAAGRRRRRAGIGRAGTAQLRRDDIEARCAALDVQARALDYAGRRAEARRVWIRQAEEAAAAGLTEARLRAVVQLGKLEVFEGTPPDRLYEAVDLARAAGALVEQAWAEENLAIALVIQGDPARARRSSTTRSRAAVSFVSINSRTCSRPAAERRVMRDPDVGECVPRRGRASRADRRPRDPHLRHPGRHRVPRRPLRRGARLVRAVRRAHAREARAGCRATVRAGSCGCSPRSGALDDATAALREARAFPDDLAAGTAGRSCSPAAEALLAATSRVSTPRSRRPPGACRSTWRSCACIAAGIIRGPPRARWLREALDIYEASGAESDAARVRQLLREAGAPVPRRRRRGRRRSRGARAARRDLAGGRGSALRR